MNGPSVSAVLVNYNAGDELRHALQSIADDVGDDSWEAVVVDNASSDGSMAAVAQFAPLARSIRNRRNVGFAAAVNQGIAESASPVLLIMNPDCRLTAGAVDTLRQALDRHRDCAIAGPRILNPDGSVQGSARGDPDMMTGLFGRTALLQRLMPSLPAARRNVVQHESGAAAEEGVVVDWLSGACMLAKRSALTEVGGFDERYFLYWEDADLCRRLRSRGYHVRYVPAATAVHRVGHSSRTARAASVRAFHDSAYRYYATHVAPGRLNPKRLIARGVLAARCWWVLRAAD